MNKSIRVTINDIDAFAACVEDIFVNEEYVGRIVGWLSNHDIRRSLQIAQRVIASPTMKIESLVAAYVIGNRALPRRREIKRALSLRGRADPPEGSRTRWGLAAGDGKTRELEFGSVRAHIT